MTESSINRRGETPASAAAVAASEASLTLRHDGLGTKAESSGIEPSSTSSVQTDSPAAGDHDAQRLAEMRDIPLLRRQDAAAFGRLVAQQQAMVLGLCQTLGLRSADRDDAAAEIFAAVYQALPNFDGRASLATWIYRIAWRTIVRMRQRLARGAASAQTPDVTDASPTPAAQSETAETNALLWQAVASLKPRQAAAVELFYRREMSVEQIAAVLECPAATVNTLLFRARQQLKEKLARRKIGM